MHWIAKCLMIAVVAWMGAHAATCLAGEAAGDRAEDARAIYGAFMAQWMGKDDAPISVASTVRQPSQEDIDQYNECAGGGKGRSIHWTTGTTDADIKSALAPFDRVKLVDPKRWRAADPGELIAKGESVDVAVKHGIDGGLMTLSAISFNEAHDIAIFSFSFVCGGLCGHGGTVMFKKTSRGWVQGKEPCSSWMS